VGEDSLLDPFSIEDEGFTEGRLEVGDVAFNGFVPVLSTASLWEPTGVCAEVDKLLVEVLFHSSVLINQRISSKCSSFNTTRASFVFP